MNLLLDVNVILDVLANRRPWVDDSATLLQRIREGRCGGKIAAHTVTTLHYLLTKHSDRQTAVSALQILLQAVEVVPVDGKVINRALSMGWDDFEDAVQGVCAVNSGVDYLATRNQDDFNALSIPVVTPEVVLGLLEETDGR